MADFTPNYNLKKPLRTEYYNVADANGNNDIVDTQLKAVNDRVGLVEGEVDALELGKVDKVTGKGLSTNDYTTTEKNKLAGIPADTAAQLAEKALKTEVGLLSGLLTTAKTSIVAAINELFNSKANKAQEDWIIPTLVGGTTGTARYRKNSIGQLEIVLDLNTTSSLGTALTLFQLPSGYRPSVASAFESSSWSINPPTFSKIEITTAGNVLLYPIATNTHATSNVVINL